MIMDEGKRDKQRNPEEDARVSGKQAEKVSQGSTIDLSDAAFIDDLLRWEGSNGKIPGKQLQCPHCHKIYKNVHERWFQKHIINCGNPPAPPLSGECSNQLVDPVTQNKGCMRSMKWNPPTDNTQNVEEARAGCKSQAEQMPDGEENSSTCDKNGIDDTKIAAPRPGPSHSIRQMTTGHSSVASKQRSTSVQEDSSSESMPSSASTADSDSSSSSSSDEATRSERLEELSKSLISMKQQMDLLIKRNSIKKTMSPIPNRISDQRKEIIKKRKLDTDVGPEPVPKRIVVEKKGNAANSTIISSSATATSQEATNPKSKIPPETVVPMTEEEIMELVLDMSTLGCRGDFEKSVNLGNRNTSAVERVRLIKKLPVNNQWDLQRIVTEKLKKKPNPDSFPVPVMATSTTTLPAASTSLPSNTGLDGYKQKIEENCQHIAKLEEEIREKDKEVARLTALPDWTDCGDSQLHLAVSQNDIKTVRDLIQNGADVNTTNDDGETPLHRAAKHFRNKTTVDIIKTLIENGSDAFLEENNKRTFLPYLTGNGCRICTPALFHEITAYLLKKNSELIRLFIASSPDEECSTVLRNAVKNMDLEGATLKLLYAHGLNFKAFSQNNHDLLKIAVDGGRSSAFLATLVKFLLKMNIVDLQYVKLRSKLILFYIAARGDSNTLEYFLSLGLDINVVDPSGDTPLHCVLKSWKGNVLEAAQFMILEGGNPIAENNLQQTPLHYAALYVDRDASLELIKLLVDSGADVFKENNTKRTFLHYLILRSDLTPSLFHEFVMYLAVKKYLKLFEKKDLNGYTPLELALEYLHVESRTLTILQRQGILEPDKFTTVKTMRWLTRFMMGGNVEALQYLILKLRLDVNTQEHYYKNSPLHQAVSFGQRNVLGILQTLINAGANVDLKNKGGLIPLDIVMSRENVVEKEKVIHLLMNGTLPATIHDSDVIMNGVVGTHAEQSGRVTSCSKEPDDEERPTSEHGQIMNSESCANAKKVIEFEEPQLKIYKEALRISQRLTEEVAEKNRKIERLYIMKFRNETWDTELHLAVKEGDEKAVKELVLSGAPVNAINKNGEIPLHKAAQCKDEQFDTGLRIIKFLLKNEADIFARNNARKTPLWELIIRGGKSLWTPGQFHKIVELLVEQNIEIFNSRCEGLRDDTTPFQLALYQIDVKKETLSLLRNCVNFNAVGGNHSKSFSVLACAIAGGRSLSLIDNLVKFGADPHFINNRNENMLHIATRIKDVHLELLKYLLNLGLDINAVDTSYETLLQTAVSCRWDKTGSSTNKLVQFLIANGANPNIGNRTGRTPLLIAANYIGSKETSIGVIKYLINNGANPFTEVGEGETFLYELVNSIRDDSPFPPSLFYDFVQYLVKDNYSKLLHTRRRLKEKPEESIDPLELAMTKGILQEYTLSFLEGHGQFQKIRNGSECRLLHFAAKHGDVKVLEFLVKLEWNINQKDSKGLTPLQFALLCENHQEELSECVKMLLEAGADKAVKHEGKTILETLLQNGSGKYLKKEFDKIVALLQ